LEIDTEFFAIRFVGAPGGKNLLAPLHIPRRLRTANTVADPGGLTFHLTTARDERRVHGPAEVVERSVERVIVRSAVDEDTGVRLRLEGTVGKGEGTCSLVVAMETASTEPHTLGLTARGLLAPETILRLPK